MCLGVCSYVEVTLKILVLVKNVPDTETKVKLNNGQIDESEFKYMVNPYDEFAIEEAIVAAEKLGGAETVVVSAGPTRVQEGMRKALAMGIDRGIWINTEGGVVLDSLGLAKILAKVVQEEKPDVVLAGHMAIDDYASHIGPMVAELCSMPSVQVVSKISWQTGGKQAQVEREVEGGMVEVYDVQLPAVLGAHKSLNTPRFPSLPGIMKAKKKPLAEKKLSELAPEKPVVSIVSYSLPAEKAPGKVFKGEPVDVMVKKVVQLLRSEAKVI
jgi:electron transfer flavoprotein beta subunit